MKTNELLNICVDSICIVVHIKLCMYVGLFFFDKRDQERQTKCECVNEFLLTNQYSK